VETDLLTFVVEIPCGGRGLAGGASALAHAGFLDGTLRADGRPLPAILWSERSAPSGAELAVRAVGLAGGETVVCRPAEATGELPPDARSELERIAGGPLLGPDAAFALVTEARARWATANVRLEE
jgi:hypothetical protein